MKVKNQIDKAVTKVINCVTGSGLSQSENTASGEKYINKNMASLIRECGDEGIVLLKNNGVLPLDNKSVSVFGRCSINYFYVGYGSGGDVHPPYKVNLIDGLKNAKVNINKSLLDIYYNWIKQNPINDGYWGHWPYNYEEMPLSDDIVKNASENSDLAIVVIGRAAGEDRENKLTKGSYYLTDCEVNMLDKVTKYFANVVVILDCGNIIDLSKIASYGDKISAILYAFQLGMESGNAVADVLSGKVSPSGKLSDSIAINYSDYPSSDNFGGKDFNCYKEDIFVGYRYFETFNKNVLYPFGFGLSYTKFNIENISFDIKNLVAKLKVTNVGNYSGKEIVQVYLKYPKTVLSNPSKRLVGFCKTKLLLPNESEEITIKISKDYLFSYDDFGKIKKSSYVLEKGTYTFVAGNSIRANLEVARLNVQSNEYLPKKAICPVSKQFSRLITKEENGKIVEDVEIVKVEDINLKTEIENNLPKELVRTDKKLTFDMLKKGTTVEEFVASLSNKELRDLACGEGKMNSKFGTVGNAGAYCSSKSLKKRGIKPIITCDGPAGIRIKKYTSLLPCGTSLATTWNEQLVESLYKEVSNDMVKFNVDVLLAPGVNIHRNPLCGRNFEYFSEDPLLAGKMASSCIKGIQHNNKVACIKHFACNNQEVNRNKNDSIVSERALREIYLKPFEIAIKEANPKNIMTSYNKVNGIYSYYNYYLATEILHKEFGYTGVIITDWWVKKAVSPEFKKVKNNAYRVRAGVDVIMPGSLSRISKYDFDRSLNRLNKKDSLSVAELQQTAIRLVNLLLYLDRD